MQYLTWKLKTLLILVLIGCFSENAQAIGLVAEIDTSTETADGKIFGLA